MNGTSKSKSQHNLNQVKQNRLVLINDDFNTFDHVVDCLVSLCDHTPIQA